MNQRRSLALRERPPRHGKRRVVRPAWRLLGLGAALAAALIVVFAFVLFARDDGATEPGSGPAPAAAAKVVGGVVVQQASVDLGRQPLDKSVSHSFVVKNTNDRAVQLGVPAIEVLDGC